MEFFLEYLNESLKVTMTLKFLLCKSLMVVVKINKVK